MIKREKARVVKVGSMVRFCGKFLTPCPDTLGILTEVFKYQSGLVRVRVRWFTGDTPPENLWLKDTDVVLV